MNSSSANSEAAPPPPVPTGAVTVSVATTASKTPSSPFVRAEQAPPPTDPEAVLRARYGGLLPAHHKKRGPNLHKGHLHQHFDSADWSMAKARAGGGSGASSLSSAAGAALPLSATLEEVEVAPPRLAPEPPAPRRASHLGEASKQQG